MRVAAIQTGKVQIKSRQLEPRVDPRPARAADILADRRWSPRLPILGSVIEHPEGTLPSAGLDAEACSRGEAAR